MVNDMRFCSETVNAPDNLRLETLDLTETIQGLVEYFEVWVEDQGVALQTRGQVTAVKADRELLRRAISNLLSNAIRYTPRGNIVTVRLYQDLRTTTISVENPGQKIPTERSEERRVGKECRDR